MAANFIHAGKEVVHLLRSQGLRAHLYLKNVQSSSAQHNNTKADAVYDELLEAFRKIFSQINLWD